MKSCIILGAARSGTSLTAGCLAKAGYFMGDDLMKPRESNPRGFFEDYHINAINDRILLATQSGVLRHLPKGASLAGKWFGYHHKWLLELPTDKPVVATTRQRDEIKKVVQKKPFCFKDPRFCYTYPIWKPYIEDAVRVCVFRHPAECAKSIVKESRTQVETRDMKITIDDALNIYRSMYERVLQYTKSGEWLFIHYRQIINGDGVTKLSKALNVSVDMNFPDQNLYRNRSNDKLGINLSTLYEKLCELAEYQDD